MFRVAFLQQAHSQSQSQACIACVAFFGTLLGTLCVASALLPWVLVLCIMSVDIARCVLLLPVVDIVRECRALCVVCARVVCCRVSFVCAAFVDCAAVSTCMSACHVAPRENA